MSNSQDKKSRNRKKKGKKTRPKGKKGNNQSRGGGMPHFLDNQHVKPAGMYSGIMEVTEKGIGYLRKLDHEFTATQQDPFVVQDMVRFFNLKPGLLVEGEIEQDQRGTRRLVSVKTVNGKPYEVWAKAVRFDLQTPIMPVDQIKLSREPDEIELRVIDLIAPIGKGQRALIVAPPRTGKTVLLKNIARAIDDYHPDIELAVLLVDERPEEVTDFIRSTRGRVFASSNDKSTKSHTRISELSLGYVKRRAEMGQDAVLLIDSITRLSRAYNAAQSGGGRTMSGGLDIRALDIPKKIFGSARKIENGGSLTIIATCLVETNSRMDDLIFEEFKGTGNMELVLDREIANERIFPAINIGASGTRNEDRFIDDSLEERNMVRRYLLKKSPKESMASLLQVLKRTQSNEELLNQIAAYV